MSTFLGLYAHARSRHRRGVEQHQCTVQLPVFGPGLFAAGDIERQAEQLPIDIFGRRRAFGHRAGVEVHQVMLALRQLAARGDLVDGTDGQAVGRAAAGGKDMQAHCPRRVAGCRR